MQYSPKLKKAMQEIKEILDKYDIAGNVVLHIPKFSEYLMKIDPSYSCAKLEGSDMIRIKANAEEDFGGDKEARNKAIMDTANMLNIMAEVTSMIAINYINVSKVLDEKVGAVHTPPRTTGHDTQNN